MKPLDGDRRWIKLHQVCGLPSYPLRFTAEPLPNFTAVWVFPLTGMRVEKLPFHSENQNCGDRNVLEFGEKVCKGENLLMAVEQNRDPPFENYEG